MELSKQNYDSIMQMPIKRMYDYIKWKSDLEDEKAKLIEESQLKSKGKTKLF